MGGPSSFWQNTATHGVAVTPSDSAQILDANSNVVASRMLYIGGAGTLKIQTDKNQALTFGAVVAGTIIPIETSKVFATGTSATNIIALY